MRENYCKKLLSTVSAIVLAATQVAPAISVSAEEASAAAAADASVEVATSTTPADGDYVYCYASMTWAEYWENEGVYLSNSANGDWAASVDTKDSRETAEGYEEYDLGAYDAVTRATSNHGLHRSSFQCVVKVYDTEGNAYDYTGKGQDEPVDVVSTKNEDGTSTDNITVNGEVVGTYDHSENIGPKYVPVAVPADQYEDFKKAYTVYENGDTITGGNTEKNLVNINETVSVDANTSGLKVASEAEDGTFDFAKRTTADTADDKVVDSSALEIGEVQFDSGYGDFIRVDIKGDYGDLGAHMYAVRWDYYGDGDTVLATYGTKFAADNWMHKSMGIQLGLTKSLRCELPEGTDGYGKWDVTIYATGYQDYTFSIDAEPDEYVYGTMDIPFADFYYAELGNNTDTTEGTVDYTVDLAGDAGLRAENVYDAVTSATGNKWKNMFADTTYSSEADENGGGQILGVKAYPVAIEKSLYEELSAATDKSGVLGTLFDSFTVNEDQTVVPTAYKQLYADGTLSTTISENPEVDLTGATVELSTDSRYGDYQLDISDLDLGEDNTLYGVVLKGKAGNYALFQLENIWRNGTELSWSAGYKTTEVHGNTLRSTPYAATSGDTLTEITYLTANGEYSIHLTDGLYLPKKHSGNITAESVDVTSGSIPVTLNDFPDDFDASVSADGLTDATYADGALTYDAASATPGSYDISASDASGVYAPVATSVTLTTEDMPAAYDADKKAIVAADGATDAQLAAYLGNIATVTVDGTDYSASGRRGVKIIDTTTGALDLTVSNRGTAVFGHNGTYEVTVTATGYSTPLTFSVDATDLYVYGTVNLPYADYYYGELNNVEANATMDLETADPAAALRAEGYYDAVTSATNTKSVKYGATYFTENEDGSVTVEGIKDVAIAVPTSLYNDAKAAIEAGTACNNQLLTIIGNMTVNEDQTVVPTEYKVLNGDGTLGAMQDSNEAITLTDATVEIETNTRYGNYQLNINENLAEDEESQLPTSENMEGVVITMTDGSEYAMLHVDNLWLRTGEMAWAVEDGFVVHSVNTLKYKNFEDTSGKTVASVRYIVRGGADVIINTESYLPKMHDGAVAEIEAVPVASGTVSLEITGLPDDYEATASIDGVEATYADSTLTYDAASVQPGEYTVIVSDKTGVYAPIETGVVLTTDELPVTFDAATKTIVAAEGADEAAVANFLSNMATATVNDTEYALSGRGSTKLFDTTTGALQQWLTTREGGLVFSKADNYTFTVSATGYTTPLTFSVDIGGDVDMDGDVDPTDLLYVLQYSAYISAGYTDFTLSDDADTNAKMVAIADIDGDGEVGSKDVFDLLYYNAYISAGYSISWDDVPM